ncbi:hypothetical protein ASPCAL11972 [Aspergillus calidoustus]|uniref:Uncharacterized protein n=1 Tax=Aspergillus calidoustus TaxID=454130 RepID=A0A0U5GAW4_ASPCI|nr:hypothetical protein ASPCAL11972 [Aspergillus calidoustus]
MSYSTILLNGNTSGFRTFPPTAPKSVKRPLEDSDEEPYYFTRGSVNGYVRKTWELASPSSESFAGVSADLPDAPFEATQPVLNYYKRLPVLRKLDWREDDNGQPIRRELANTRTLIAGYVQTRGQLAETPCTFCTQGKGIWQECVIGSDTQDERPMTKACANCRFSGRSACNLRSGSSSSQSPAPRIVELEDGDDTSLGTKRTKFKAEGSRTPSRHDGKVIPFPLDPGTIGNLPLLKQAAEDLAAHLAVVKARINQLDEEKRKKTTRNPWDLVSTDGAQ